MPSYTIRATDKETGEVRLMKVQAGTPMTEVIKQSGVRHRRGIARGRMRFLVARQAAEDGQTAGRAGGAHGDAAAAVRRNRRRRRGRLLVFVHASMGLAARLLKKKQ